MEKWCRFFYQPCLPLGENGTRVTGNREHIELSRQAAAEGMVLLKNEGNVLPFEKGQKLAVFGKAGIDYVRGGGGSAEVNSAYSRNLNEGLGIKEQEGKIQLFHPIEEFYKENVQKQYEQGSCPGMTVEPEVPEDLLESARIFTDTAIVTICRYSGEGWDRKSIVEKQKGRQEKEAALARRSAEIFENGDFCLTEAEKRMVEKVKKTFSHVVVVINAGGMVDTTWFKNDEELPAVLMAWQGGMEGGLAAADILCGDVNPSGKLVDTFAKTLEDYPSTEGFHESLAYVDYKEDIYVGYRYFETLPGAKEKVNYPFGFGLSYTNFTIAEENACVENEKVKVKVRVTNTGKCPGKEVVQIYYKAPQGKLGRPLLALAAFEKSGNLKEGESQILTLEFSIKDMAAFDDLGKISKSAYVLEAGEYEFYFGNSCENLEKSKLSYTVSENIITEQLTSKAAPYHLTERMLSDGSYEKLPLRELEEEKEGLEPQNLDELEGMEPALRGYGRARRVTKEAFAKHHFREVAEGEITLDEFMEQMTVEQMAELLGGQPNTGIANTYGIGNMGEYGIPNVMTADGPAGFRIKPKCEIYSTAFPCATMLACTWNTKLVEEVGKAGAKEIKENNIGAWLTPAMNIHRSPLCGRNFEYYSEDPLVTGKMGSAMIRGIQSQHIAAAMKHFACNNKESNRKDSDSRVSERALREIYLKGFEIAVKEAEPWMIMSSYNKVNGYRASENQEMLTGILRDEWGFKGMVTSDWWTLGEHYKEAKAGNDLKMGCGYPERVLEALEKGLITREEIYSCVKRILEMILKLD